MFRHRPVDQCVASRGELSKVAVINAFDLLITDNTGPARPGLVDQTVEAVHDETVTPSAAPW